jgi:hypothetical protein
MNDIVPLDKLLPGAGRIGSVEGTLDRARYALSLPFKSVYELLGAYKGRKAIVCGGGPSLKDTLPDIRRILRLSKKCDIIALNKTHDYLLAKGVDPKRVIGVMIDPKPWVAGYMTPTKGVRYLLGSKLHKDTFDRFANHADQVYLWQVWEHKDEELNSLAKEFPHKHIVHIPGFSTVGLRALNLGYDLGYRDFELHGYDSSHADDNATHAYRKDVPRDDNEDVTMIIDGDDGQQRGYLTNVHMARQVKEFFDLMDQFDRGGREPINVKVAGTGALQYSVVKKLERGRTRACHVNPLWNREPDKMPGGIRTVPRLTQVRPAEPVFKFEPVMMDVQGNSFSDITISL